MKHRLTQPEIGCQRSEVSAFVNPRILCAFALCSCGVLLGMFSLAATPPVQQPVTDLSAVASLTGAKVDPSSALPPGVPLPAGAQLGNSLTAQSDPLSAAVPARLPRLKGMPLGSQMASPASSLGNSVLPNQQPAALTPNAPARESIRS